MRAKRPQGGPTFDPAKITRDAIAADKAEATREAEEVNRLIERAIEDARHTARERRRG